MDNNQVLRRLWDASLGSKADVGVDADDVVEACRAPWPAGFASFVLPLLAPHHEDLLFEVLEELTLAYEWATGIGYAKVVLPQVFFRSPERSLTEFKILFEHGTPRQQKAVAEALRAVAYRDSAWVLRALAACVRSDHETIKKEAPRALPCLTEIDVFAAEEVRQWILADPVVASLLGTFDSMDAHSRIRLVQRQQWIDVEEILARSEPPGNFVLMLALGLPGLMLVDPAAALRRMKSFSYVNDATIQFTLCALLTTFGDIDASAARVMAENLAHSREFQIRRLTTIPLSRSAAAGNRSSADTLATLASDQEPLVASVAKVGLEASRAVLAKPAKK